MIIFPSPVQNTYRLQFASFETIAKRNLIAVKIITYKPSYPKLKYTKGNSLDNASITSSLSVQLLRITFDSDLKFEEQVNKIGNIVHRKLNAYIVLQAILA